MVDQFRDGFDKLIQLNPTDAKYFRDGSLITETVRFSHESASVPANKATPVGLGTNFSMFLEMYFDSGIQENDILIDTTTVNAWKVGVIDTVYFQGEAYGKHAPLYKVVPKETNSITSFRINNISGIISVENITVTLSDGTDVTALTPVIAHSGKMIEPTGAQDFTNTVTYTVTAEKLSTKDYIVTVVLA